VSKEEGSEDRSLLFFLFFVFGINDLAFFLLSQFVRDRDRISLLSASGDIWGKNQCDIRNPF